MIDIKVPPVILDLFVSISLYHTFFCPSNLGRRQYLNENKKEYILSKQLLRSGTSIGANIHEGNYAASKADFINKFQIALKECYETDYWLDIFKRANILTEIQYKTMFAKCSKIRKLLIASINTAKQYQ